MYKTPPLLSDMVLLILAASTFTVTSCFCILFTLALFPGNQSLVNLSAGQSCWPNSLQPSLWYLCSQVAYFSVGHMHCYNTIPYLARHSTWPTINGKNTSAAVILTRFVMSLAQHLLPCDDPEPPASAVPNGCFSVMEWLFPLLN